jgi:3-oxoacyl-[acyl-carrier protein] reductase
MSAAVTGAPHAFITGATSDIGAAIVRTLAATGYSVTVHYRSRGEAAEALVQEVTRTGGYAVAVQADVSDLQQVRAAVANGNDALGPVRALVNVAADVRFSRFMDSDPADWWPQIAVTLGGCLNTCRAAADTMAAEGAGRIVNIVGEGALVGEPALAVASAAKAGVIGFTRTLALELAAQGVTVNAVSPGFIPTQSIPESLRTPERLAKIAKRYPAGRLGTVQEIASAVGFLVSEDAGYITGQTISVSGGYSTR